MYIIYIYIYIHTYIRMGVAAFAVRPAVARVRPVQQRQAINNNNSC